MVLTLLEMDADRAALALLSADELGTVAGDAEDLAAYHHATAERYARQARVARQEQAARLGRIR